MRGRLSLSLLALLLSSGCEGTISAAEHEASPPPGLRAGEGAAGLAGPGVGGSRAGETPTGEGGGAGTGGAGTAPGPPPGEPGAPARALGCGPGRDAPGPRRLWRLTPAQYQNAIHAFWVGRTVIGRWTNPPPARIDVQVPFDGVNTADRFTNFARSFTMSDDELWRVLEAADDYARQLVATAAVRACVDRGAGGLGACLRPLLADRGRTLFSRALRAAELDEYAALADAAAAAVDPREAAVVAFQALLAAPDFLYRSEGLAGTPDAAGVVKLTPHEIAAAISYTLLDAPPDPPLWAAADGGALATPEQIRPQVERMLGLPTRYAVAPKIRLFREYLQYDQAPGVFKEPKDYPFHKPEMLVEDMDAWIGDLVARHGAGGFLEALLTAPTAFVRGSYTDRNFDLSLPRTQHGVRTMLDPTRRAGFLTQPAFLTAFSGMDENHPVQRGKFVREGLLCGAVPSLPLNAVPPLPDLGPGATVRDKLRVHVSGPGCWGCHALMDPLGLVFEGYDHVGRHRTTEKGRPVDATGYLTGAGPVDGPVNGAVELAHRLAASRVVSECFAQHVFEFVMGRSALATDECALHQMHEAFVRGGGDLVGMLTALFSSPTFQLRSAR